MIEKLLSIFGVGAIHRVAMVVQVGSQVVRTFEQEFSKDLDAKNAAIDAVIDLLQKHKEVTVAEAEGLQTATVAV